MSDPIQGSHARRLAQRTVMAGRLRIITACFGIWALVLVGRILWIQVVRHKPLSQAAQKQQFTTEVIRARRGTIMDRNNRPLAISKPILLLTVNPQHIPDRILAADLLANVLNLPFEEVERRIREAAYSESSYGYANITDTLTEEQWRRLRAMNLPYIQREERWKRTYPKKQLAAHLVGTVNDEQYGNSGLEQALNAELSGDDGRRRRTKRLSGNGASSMIVDEAHAGKDVRLTIDERIQFAVEDLLQKTIESEKIPSGSVVVMRVETGEILAMANWPTFDPNERVRGTAAEIAKEMKRRENLAVHNDYEPGSVAKIVTVTAAMEKTRLRPESPIFCGNGILRLPGRVIHDAHPYATLPVELVLAKSSNIGTINIGMTVGRENLYDYFTRFGFGQLTRSPFLDESAGVLHKLERWETTSLASIAMGHEITATTLQLAQAMNVLAANGRMIRPRFVLPEKGELEPAEGEQVIRPETAIMMRRMLETVMLQGTGKTGKLNEYRYTSGGKTGTAQLFDRKLGRYVKKYSSSFVGMAPLVKPEIVVAVTLHETPKYGGEVAAPVFKEVARRALEVLGVAPDLPETEPSALPRQPAQLESPSVAKATVVAKAPLLVSAASDKALRKDAAATETVVESEPEIAGGRPVPDFRGLTMQAVMARSAESGLAVSLVGSGVAARQEPEPGRRIGAGRRIRVYFQQ